MKEIKEIVAMIGGKELYWTVAIFYLKCLQWCQAGQTKLAKIQLKFVKDFCIFKFNSIYV